MIRMLVAVIPVRVVTDVKMEVKKTRAELSVTVPVVGGAQGETADADNTRDRQTRSPPSGELKHGPAETLHLCILS
jgi:hypothetical protein